MSEVREPRGYISVGGAPLGFIECEVEQHKLATSDTFHAKLPLTQDYDAAYWLGLDKADAEVFFNGTSMIQATLEKVDVDFLEQSVDISGKDKTKDLLDTRSNKSFKNKTPKQVVEEIAQAHGLQVQADAGAGLSGKTYQIDHNLIMDQESDWSVINRLAQIEGFDAWVKGSTLYFKEADDDNDPAYTITYSEPTPEQHANGDFIRLRVSHNLTLAKTVKVKAESWSMKQKKALSHEETLGGNAAGTLNYHYRAAGLTQDQVEKKAKKHLKNNTRHEFSVEVELPGDGSVNPMMRLQLQGTGAADQAYYIDSISHHMSSGIGYRMTIHAKNKKEGRG